MSNQADSASRTQNNAVGLVVKKINPVTLLIVSMVMINVIIVGLIYGKYDEASKKNGQLGLPVGGGPDFKRILRDLYALANSSGSVRHYINLWNGNENVTIT